MTLTLVEDTIKNFFGVFNFKLNNNTLLDQIIRMMEHMLLKIDAYSSI
jgi:hypothetical protein